MSGGYVPYHLRQNKYIDRQLFLDLLLKIHRFRSLSKHAYIGFGGASLEDFKIVHSYFGTKRMISIEENGEVHKRQKFNSPVKCIECRLESSSDFVGSYSVNGNAVIWLDYSSPEPRQQLQEFQALLPKLRRYDVLKITLNANLETIRSTQSLVRDDIPPEKWTAERLKTLQEKFEDLLPDGIEAQSMTEKKYPRVLCEAAVYAGNMAMDGQENIFYPLTAFTYADSSHRMLTYVGIVIQEDELKLFLKETDIEKWPFRYDVTSSPILITVPALTIREKLFIDSRLPAKRTKSETLQKKLGFLFDDDEDRSLEMLSNYMLLYREYPNFSEILI